MKIKNNLLSIGILILALCYIFIDFGASTSLLGDKAKLEAEKRKLITHREIAQINADSFAVFIKKICDKADLSCTIERNEDIFNCEFNKDQERKVQSVFLCGVEQSRLAAKQTYEIKGNSYSFELNKINGDKLLFQFPMENKYVVLPSIIPACLAPNL